MITLREIDTRHSDYATVERLLHEAFPTCERRDDEAQRANTDSQPRFHCLAIYDGERVCGLLTYWDFDDVWYVEHFAVLPQYRGQGLGADAIGALLRSAKCQVVLEVEQPTDEISRRRITFYERQGLHLWASHKYVQPPYRAADAPTPMIMMGTQDADETDYKNIRALIYRHVYGVERPEIYD